MNPKFTILILFAGVILSCGTGKKTSGETLLLVEKGRPMAEIIIANNPTRATQLAALELQRGIEKISGATLPIAHTPSAKYPVKVFIGHSRFATASDWSTKNLANGTYRTVVKNNYLYLLGDDNNFVPTEPYAHARGDVERATLDWQKATKSDWENPRRAMFKAYSDKLNIWEGDGRGTLNAVYGLLREVGMEWYLPGPTGEIVPRKSTVEIPRQDKTVQPAFPIRILGFHGKSWFQSSDDDILWHIRLGANNGAELLGNGPIGHGSRLVHAHPNVRQSKPLYFGVFNGKRDVSSRDSGKPCLSSKDLLQENIRYAQAMFDLWDEPCVSVMPTDGYAELCSCDLCKGKDTPARGFEGKISDYVWGYVNEVAKALYKTHPDKKIICFAYGAYLLPPQNIERLSPNIIVGICRWRTDLLDAQKKTLYDQINREWTAKANNTPLLLWDYYLHAKPDNGMSNLPVVFPHLIFEDIKSRKNNSLGEFVEVYREYTGFDCQLDDLAFNHINVAYTAALYWNPDIQPEEWLRQYCEKMYGPVADDMFAFINACEQTWASRNTAVLIKKIEKILLKLRNGSPEHGRVSLLMKYLKKEQKN